MGNIVETIKRFLQNKNTVTILAVLAGVIVLWYFYNRRVDEAITTIKIPYAIAAIDTTNKIDADNIGFKEITQVTTKDSDIITNSAELDGKYICKGTSVPKDGFFYRSQICEKKDIPGSVAEDLEPGYALYNLAVNARSTYGNSIEEGQYIDIYVSAETDEGSIIYAPLIESIRVKAVKDSSNKDVFWDSTAGDTAYLIFAVPENVEGQKNIYRLLTMTDLENEHSISLVPVLRGHSYTESPGSTQVTSEEIEQFIMQNYSWIE